MGQALRGLAAAVLTLSAFSGYAAPWSFAPPIEVARVHGDKIFHHLESAGRKSIAVSEATVAVAWEDNRSGAPQSYVAFKGRDAPEFETELKVSLGREAYEPSLVALGQGLFAVAWEQDGTVWARVVAADGAGPPVQLAAGGAAQAALGFSDKGGMYAAWAQKDGRFSRIMAAQIGVDRAARALTPGAARPVDTEPPQGDQLYPSLAVGDDGAVVVAWEDRRRGHTVILYSRAALGKGFGPLALLNEPRWGGRGSGLGRGTGAMRVALARYGEEDMAAVWADKRDFLSGYDVYVALTQNGGRRFGANQKVQDPFGNDIAQWHPAIAGNRAGLLAVAWDDDRDGTPDLWLAWPEKGGFSDNLAVPGASGPGVQSDPAIALDEQGDLHVAWIEKRSLNAPTRIRYVFGKFSPGRE